MFCSQCGKKVLDSMLFCPFCGSPIVVPDQEVIPEQPPSPDAPEPETPSASEVEEAARRAVESFVPLNLSTDWSGEDVEPASMEEFAAEESVQDFVPLDLSELDMDPPGMDDEPVDDETSGQLREEPVRAQERAPVRTSARPSRTGKGGQRKSATYVPVREFNPDDIFLDGGDQEDDEEDLYAYEEPEEGGFWIRHIRGVVALSLMVIVLAIVAGWAFSGAGQMALARANLAWNAETYARLAHDAYEAKNYLLSASYYERALAHDSSSYTYANSAGVAYYLAEDANRAADMAKKAIGIDPSKVDAYQLLLRLYPDKDLRPWVVESLLQQGYQLTGDPSLKTE